jgi:hypothetical protein
MRPAVRVPHRVAVGGSTTLIVVVLAMASLLAATASASPPREQTPRNEKVVTSESYCAGATPSPAMGGVVLPYADEQFEVARTVAGRSGCWSGNQYIEVTHKLYEWNGSRAAWIFHSQRADGGWNPPGSHWIADGTVWRIIGGLYGYYSLNIVYGWWRKNSAGAWVRIGYRTRRFIHSGDYDCYGVNSYYGGTCSINYIGGRYGNFLWSF